MAHSAESALSWVTFQVIDLFIGNFGIELEFGAAQQFSFRVLPTGQTLELDDSLTSKAPVSRAQVELPARVETQGELRRSAPVRPHSSRSSTLRTFSSSIAWSKGFSTSRNSVPRTASASRTGWA